MDKYEGDLWFFMHIGFCYQQTQLMSYTQKVQKQPIAPNRLYYYGTTHEHLFSIRRDKFTYRNCVDYPHQHD